MRVQSSTADLPGSDDLTMADCGQRAPRRGVDVRKEALHYAAGQKSVGGDIALGCSFIVSRRRYRRRAWSVSEYRPRRREQAESLPDFAGKKSAEDTGDAHGTKESDRGIGELRDVRVRKGGEEPSFPASRQRASGYPDPGPLEEVSVRYPGGADGLTCPASQAAAEVNRERPGRVYTPVSLGLHQIQASPR